MNEENQQEYPALNDTFYVPGRSDPALGQDDRIGGLVRIGLIEEGGDTIWVCVYEFPTSRFGFNRIGPWAWNGERTQKEQTRLRQIFGDQRAHLVSY